MKRYCVIGLGSFGYYAAKTLFEEGNEVIAIDAKRERVQAIENYCTDAIVLDATDKEKLKAMGLDEMDAVVISTGERISSSILICYYLQEFNVKRIVVKAVDIDHAQILKMIGATETIHPEKDMAERIARSLTKPNILNFVPLEEGYDIIQVEAPEVFAEQTLEDLHLRKKYKVFVIAIKKKGEEKMILAPPADYQIQKSDQLIFLGKTDDIEKVKELKS